MLFLTPKFKKKKNFPQEYSVHRSRKNKGLGTEKNTDQGFLSWRVAQTVSGEWQYAHTQPKLFVIFRHIRRN